MAGNSKLETSATVSLNVEGVDNVPVCPLCQTVLEDVPTDYEYARMNPDTRWFWCTGCKAHLGYHRMKGEWKVDPYDLEESPELRAHFGLTPEDGK